MKSLALFNIKGGVGKTTAAVNLAYAAVLEGKKVLFWDMDPQGSATFYFQIRHKVKGGVEKLFKSSDKIKKHIKSTQFKGLDIIPSDISERNLDLVLDDMKKSTKRVKMIFEEVKKDYDLIVVDSHPHLSILSENLFKAVDYLVIPLIPTVLSLRTWKVLYDHLRDYSVKDTQVLPFFSMADRRKRMHKEILEKGLDGKISALVSVIPYKSEIEKMGERLAPIQSYAPRSSGGLLFKALWQEISQIIR